MGKSSKRKPFDFFGSSVHHTDAFSDGAFLLLVTFRKYAFHLDETSVAFALASCLSGSS
jgi:hypothetical protein